MSGESPAAWRTARIASNGSTSTDRAASTPTGPILIHLHGGGFRHGRRSLDAQPLINRLSAQGWLCVSADYRLGVMFPQQLIDVKRVIAWVREHAAEHGGDPDQLIIAGSSAGGHLAATAAMTPDDPRFQPFFEDVDTRVRAFVTLYAYPGPIATQGPASSPSNYATAAAPPCFLAHGDLDTSVIVEDFRAFARTVADRSRRPVVTAELPGAQHGFDLFHSIRCEAVIDGIQRFAATVLAGSPVSSRRDRGAHRPG